MFLFWIHYRYFIGFIFSGRKARVNPVSDTRRQAAGQWADLGYGKLELVLEGSLPRKSIPPEASFGLPYL